MTEALEAVKDIQDTDLRKTGFEIVLKQILQGEVSTSPNKMGSGSPSVKQTVPKKRRAQPKGRGTYKLVGGLNLKPSGKISFKDFVTEKKPGKKGTRMNAVAIYYLSKVLDLKNIGPDHVYTCYKEAGQKVPTALIQNLRDTAHLNAWIDTTNTDDIKITTAGENFVEYDLPPKDTSGGK